MSLSLGQSHSPLFAVVRNTLRERILNGEYKQGQRLVEGSLSEELGVSRIPIREALRELAAEGLVQITPRRGASVTVLSEAYVREMIEVRATLEGLNARLAAQRHDPEQLAALERVLEEGQACADTQTVEQIIAHNARFHDALGTIAANGVLQDMMRSLRARTAMIFGISNAARARENWDEHAQILQAVIRGDAELAGLLATRHVHNAAEPYFAALAAERDAAPEASAQAPADRAA